MNIAQIIAIVKMIIKYWGIIKELEPLLMAIKDLITGHPTASPEAAQCALGSVINACKPVQTSTVTTPGGTQSAPLGRRGGLFRIFRRRGNRNG